MTIRYLTDGDDAAFPIPDETKGCTKREHFAAMVLEGFCSREPIPFNDAKFLSAKAVEFADELIETLNKEAK